MVKINLNSLLLFLSFWKLKNSFISSLCLILHFLLIESLWGKNLCSMSFNTLKNILFLFSPIFLKTDSAFTKRSDQTPILFFYSSIFTNVCFSQKQKLYLWFGFSVSKAASFSFQLFEKKGYFVHSFVRKDQLFMFASGNKLF